MDGAQRQLKVLGIFARLNYRDGKAQYLDDMPRVMAYLRRTCERYIELKPLHLPCWTNSRTGRNRSAIPLTRRIMEMTRLYPGREGRREGAAVLLFP